MTFDFSDFSKYRTQLMGISILMIMLFHAFSRYFAFRWGYVGVEFFLVVSAIGMYFSLSKDSRLIPFYRKRLLRILPAYFIVAIPYFLYLYWNDFSWGKIFYNLAGLYILKGELHFWFIGLILLCYLISPFYFKLLKYRYSALFPFITLVVCFFLGQRFASLEIYINRFAIFFLGFHLAKWVHDKKRIQIRFLGLFCLVSFLLILCIEAMDCYIGIKRVLFFFPTIPVLMGCVLLLKKCPKWVHQVLIFMGVMSLELYMVHERVCLYALLGQYDYVLRGIVSFPVAIVLAYLLHKLLSLVIRRN